VIICSICHKDLNPRAHSTVKDEVGDGVVLYYHGACLLGAYRASCRTQDRMDDLMGRMGEASGLPKTVQAPDEYEIREYYKRWPKVLLADHILCRVELYRARVKIGHLEARNTELVKMVRGEGDDE